MKVLILLTILVTITNAGKILFFMPVMPKSTSMTLVPIIEELINRGHEVTLVNPFDCKLKSSKFKHIKLKTNALENTELSKQVLKGDITGLGVIKSMLPFMSGFFPAWSNVFQELKDLKFFETNEFDLVFCFAMLTGEISYYVAHKFNATLGLYSGIQTSLITTDWAMGQPHNPAILPMMGTQFKVFMYYCILYELVNDQNPNFKFPPIPKPKLGQNFG